MLSFEKNFIEFHREFYFWERFEKRVFPTDPLSRTDTFGTHCTFSNYEWKLKTTEMGNIKLRMTPAKLRKPPCKNFYWFVSNRFFSQFHRTGNFGR